jgi:hypothetical protein
MSFLGGLFKKRLDRLVTCALSDKGDYWEAMSVSSGATPQDFTEPTLTDAADRAAAEIGSLYRSDPIAAESELQFAIYPFAEGAGARILEIRRGAGGYQASAESGGPPVEGDSLEALVDAVRGNTADPSGTMFHWIRPVSELI